MRLQEVINAAIFITSFAGVATAQQRTGKGQGQAQATGSAASGAGACLNAANIQSASNSDGQADQEAGQSPSVADPANFINFCTGKTITNGLQQKQGSCNGIVMGDIPAQSNMVSTMIIFPAPGSDSKIGAGQAFDVKVKVNNLVTGSFTNPNDTYYAAPQALQGGKIVGHTHVTIQNMGDSLTPNAPLDATTFAFFKGINDDGNGQGLLTAPVAKGLPAGNYRICTLSSASNHQPVLMPVAQRGAQDDCTKFTVAEAGAANGNGQNGGQTGNAGGAQAGQGAGNAADGGNGNAGGAAADASASPAAAQTSQRARKGRQGGRGGASQQAGGAAAAAATATATATSSTAVQQAAGAGTGAGATAAATAATSAAARQGGKGQQGGAGQQASGAAAPTSSAAAQAAAGGAGGAAATQAGSSPARQAGQRTRSAGVAQGTGTGTGGNTEGQQAGGRRGGFGGFGQGEEGLRRGKARRVAVREYVA